MSKAKADKINHPEHYEDRVAGIQAIDVTQNFNFCLGNVIKYVWRAGYKEGNSDVGDLEKAEWYLKQEIARRRENASNKQKPTHYVHCNSGGALFVKEAQFFRDQGGTTESWGKAWKSVVAMSIGDARKQAAKLFGVSVSHIHHDEK